MEQKIRIVLIVFFLCVQFRTSPKTHKPHGPNFDQNHVITPLTRSASKLPA